MFEFMVQHIFSGGLAGDIGAAQTGLGVTRHRDRDVLAEMIRDVRVRSRIRGPQAVPGVQRHDIRYP